MLLFVTIPSALPGFYSIPAFIQGPVLIHVISVMEMKIELLRKLRKLILKFDIVKKYFLEFFNFIHEILLNMQNRLKVSKVE